MDISYRSGSLDLSSISNSIYDFFTNDQTGSRFSTNVLLQVTLLCVADILTPIPQLTYQLGGYLASHVIWQVTNTNIYVLVDKTKYFIL